MDSTIDNGSKITKEFSLDIYSYFPFEIILSYSVFVYAVLSPLALSLTAGLTFNSGRRVHMHGTLGEAL